MFQHHRHGFTLIEVFLVVLFIAFLAAVCVPNFIEPYERSVVSRIQADQRSMATALASYYVDHGGYPLAVVAGWSDTKVSNGPHDGFVILGAPAAIPGAGGASAAMELHRRRPTFAVSTIDPEAPGGFASLTTPIAYITSYFNDPFSPGGQATFSYLPDAPGYLLASFEVRGEKEKEATDLSTLAKTMRWQFTHRTSTPFNGRAVAMSKQLLRVATGLGNLAYTYDPTNGTASDGAVYRISD